ncbi:CPBP family intramembrane glutamic endopeptidase [Priestia flexa]|uniref:CPBP family intramembrane glutamic endopeptidase n=1 Tax=Priestia flexa TaxID=86664 RepID=UPI003D2EFA4F
MNWNKRIWSWKELTLLLGLVFIVVPIAIEYLFKKELNAILQNDLYAGTLTGLVMAVLFTVGVYVVALRPNHLHWTEVGLKTFPQKVWITITWLTLLLIIMSIIAVIVMELLGIGTSNQKTESLQSRLTFMNFMIGFISASIVSPVYEEIFYRGFLYRWFRRWGIFNATLISSLLFTLAHLPTYNTLLVNFISGIILCWAYEKTGSVVPGMIIHGVFNGIAIVLAALA